MVKITWFICCFAFFNDLCRTRASIEGFNTTNGNGLHSNISLTKCPSFCNCELGANPLYKIATMAAQNKAPDVTGHVISLCMNEHQGCLSRNENFCEQDRLASLNSLSMLAALNPHQNSKIQMLCLNNQKLVCIESSIFERFSSINALALNRNYINNTYWTKELSNTSLFYLDLSFNRLKTLQSKAFQDVKELVWLDLRHNYIEVIAPNAFVGLNNLELLDLSSNSLSTHEIYDNSFEGLPSLLHLSLADNRGISSLPNFEQIGLVKTKLETLDLHGVMFLQTIDAFAFSGMESLVTLNLSYCGLMDLKVGWLSNGPEKTLQTLDLSHNLFIQLKSSYFVSFQIRDSWKHSIQDISKFDPSINSYIVTPSVDMKHSEIFPINYKECLLNSQTTEFSEILPNLSWLSISNNPFLRKIEEDVFKFLPKLQLLFLQKCNITKLKIASSNHQFKNKGIFTTLPNLEGLWVWGNPLNCDCHVRVLLHWSATIPDEGSNNSKCWNSSEISYSGQRVNSNVYFFNNRCEKVLAPGNTMCLLGHSQTQVPINDVPYSALSCPEEPISFFVVLLIGPLTFAISIAIIGLCGFCAVTFTRVRREQSGFYASKSFEKRKQVTPVVHSPSHRRVRKGFGSHVAQVAKTRSSNVSYSLTPKPSPSLSRPYRTNIVLGKLGEPHGRASSESLRSSYLGRSPLSSPRPSPSTRHHPHRFRLSPMKGFRKNHHSRGRKTDQFLSIPKTQRNEPFHAEHSLDDDKQSFLKRETQFQGTNLPCEAGK